LINDTFIQTNLSRPYLTMKSCLARLLAITSLLIASHAEARTIA
jgi:hypothetical protein